MDIITGLINDLVGQLQNAGNEALLFAGAIIAGWIIKNVEQVPNKLIPPAVVILAAIGEVYIGDPGKVAPETNPTVRLALIGSIIGFAAWMSHAFVLKKIEEKLGWFQGDEAKLLNSDKKPGA